ncbi:DUF6036 family nucleotidyltransferase [Salisaeta longa]|uniref:DUF6036 family nucleotidyltransferase n=1 Tax=Salisaeta longa TaxID=503170 RepID=UPI0012FC9730|nr:DUF6036 family nucleotidyltransferase [Salisaeta longa]
MGSAFGPEQLEDLLTAVGDLLEAEGERMGIVVVGGASLSLLGLVKRTTSDVDVIAAATPDPSGPDSSGEETLTPPDPLPPPLRRAIQTVARDYGLPSDWMNTAIGPQWDLGLPPGLKEDISWRTYGGLRVGLVGRRTLIALKLFASVDQGPESVHVQDLVALEPTPDELHRAAEWVRSQDASPEFASMIDAVIRHVQHA